MSETSETEDARQASGAGFGAYLPLIFGLVVVVVGWAIFTSPELSADSQGGAGATSPPQAVPGGAPAEGDAALGASIYQSTCAACHGADAAGIEGLGKPLAGSEFVQSLDDDALVAFISEGRAGDDPESMTGVPMPPKGGNPALSEQDLRDVAAYLRTLS